MLRLIKTNYVFLVISTLMAAMTLNACGEKTMTPKRTFMHDFGHKLPESFRKKRDLTSGDLKPFMDGGILFWGQSIRDPKENTFDIGVQFHSKTKGRTIFVEKLFLDTPDLKTESIINESVEIDVFSESADLYFKRLIPFDDTKGDSIPLTADFFMLRIDYRLGDNPTKQMSIRFDNTSFLAPIL